MNKKINDKAETTDPAAETELKTRRRALKSIIVASGVVAGSQVLSSKWTRPLVESVVLPAHAQTSLALSFSSGIVSTKLDLNQPWYAKSNLLDTLISPAHANGDAGIRGSVCGSGATAGNNSGSYQVLFNLSGSNVQICFSSLGTLGNSQVCTQQATTSLTNQNIADVDILMDDSIDPADRQEIAELRNMAYNEASNTSTGDLNVREGPDNPNDANLCTGSFTCNLTTTAYACSTGCADS